MIETARSMIGVPFAHQGRHPRAGVDCIGLVVLAARAAGHVVEDRTTYSRRPKPEDLLPMLALHLERVPDATAEDVVAEDILVFSLLRRDLPQHVGIATGEGTFLHTNAHVGRVVETRLSGSWTRRLHSVWRWEGAARG